VGQWIQRICEQCRTTGTSRAQPMGPDVDARNVVEPTLLAEHHRMVDRLALNVPLDTSWAHRSERVSGNQRGNTASAELHFPTNDAPGRHWRYFERVILLLYQRQHCTAIIQERGAEDQGRVDCTFAQGMETAKRDFLRALGQPYNCEYGDRWPTRTCGL
jgi:hypothetical protein